MLEPVKAALYDCVTINGRAWTEQVSMLELVKALPTKMSCDSSVMSRIAIHVGLEARN